MTNAEMLIEHLKELIELNQYEKEPVWTGEYGEDLTNDIDCPHHRLSDCLNDIRETEYSSLEWDKGCSECKARWLLEEYA